MARWRREQPKACGLALDQRTKSLAYDGGRFVQTRILALTTVRICMYVTRESRKALFDIEAFKPDSEFAIQDGGDPELEDSEWPAQQYS